MSSTIRNAESGSIQDTAAERWSRLYVDVRASYGRAAIQAALLLNGAASVAFLGSLAVAQQTKGLAGNFVTFKEAFVCFGIGVMLAAGSSVVAFLIQNVAIARPRQAEGRIGRRLRSVGIGMVVASLCIFAIGITVAANALGNLVGSLVLLSQKVAAIAIGNGLLREIRTSAYEGLRWISEQQMTVNRGLWDMSRGL
jgi:hypothetical protein